MSGRLAASSLNSTWAWPSFRPTIIGNIWPWWSAFSVPSPTGMIQHLMIQLLVDTLLDLIRLLFDAEWEGRPRPSISTTAGWTGTKRVRPVATSVKTASRWNAIKCRMKRTTSSSLTWSSGCSSTSRRSGSPWRKLSNIRSSTRSRLTFA